MNLGKCDVRGLFKVFMVFAVLAILTVMFDFAYSASADADNAKLSETKVSDKMTVSENTDNLVTAAGTDDGTVEWSLFFDDCDGEEEESVIQKSVIDYSVFKALYTSGQHGKLNFIYIDLYARYTGENPIGVGALCGFLHYDTSVFQFMSLTNGEFSADQINGGTEEGKYLMIRSSSTGDSVIGTENTLVGIMKFRVIAFPEDVTYSALFSFDFYDDGNTSHMTYPTSVINHIEYSKNKINNDLNIIGQITLYENSTLTMVTADGLITTAITERGAYNENIPVYLTGVFLGQTVENLKENFINQNLVILNASGTAAADTDAIGTGWRIVIYNSDNVVADSITIILRGDIDGDGKISVSDIKCINDYIGIQGISGAYQLAADVYIDGKINIVDKKLVLDHLAGLSIYDSSITTTMRE